MQKITKDEKYKNLEVRFLWGENNNAFCEIVKKDLEALHCKNDEDAHSAFLDSKSDEEEKEPKFNEIDEKIEQDNQNKILEMSTDLNSFYFIRRPTKNLKFKYIIPETIRKYLLKILKSDKGNLLILTCGNSNLSDFQNLETYPYWKQFSSNWNLSIFTEIFG